ncbi:hypothetical protein [Bacillus sp. Bos-x628]|uniref:hypothetical protein n=1 Tax=Bacillus maqinnsis TaxID=3229854 RepID=UPI00338EF9B0
MSTYIALFCLAILAILAGATKAHTFDEIATKITIIVLLVVPIAVLLAHATGANI